jgi:predicted phosphoribosyltransferase
MADADTSMCSAAVDATMQFIGSEMGFHDRHDAGRRLAVALASYAAETDVLILALPRGGVPVAYEVARALWAPLDVFLVRKLGVPAHEELAMGAIASGGIRVLNDDIVSALRLDAATIDAAAEREERLLQERERRYRDAQPRPQIQGRVVILIDDGLATGATMRAAIEAIRQQSPSRLIVAVPVAPPETCDAIRAQVDETVCALTPRFFYGVGMWYEDFSETTDEEVSELLARSRHALASGRPAKDHQPEHPSHPSQANAYGVR